MISKYGYNPSLNSKYTNDINLQMFEIKNLTEVIVKSFAVLPKNVSMKNGTSISLILSKPNTLSIQIFILLE